MSLETADKTFHIAEAHWPEDAAALRQVREQVFILEQRVPEALEWDGEDMQALHLLARDSTDNAIGTARLLSSGRIGRMAVLSAWRGRGIGTALLTAALKLARLRHTPRPFLNAQIQVMAFYRKQGFTPQGKEFMEAGIPHIRMVLQ